MNQDSWIMAIGYAVIAAGLTCGLGFLPLGIPALLLAFLALPLYVGSIAKSLRPLHALVINLIYSGATFFFVYLFFGFPPHANVIREFIFPFGGAAIASSFLSLIPPSVNKQDRGNAPPKTDS